MKRKFNKLSLSPLEVKQSAVTSETWKVTDESTIMSAFIYLTRQTGMNSRYQIMCREMRVDLSDNEALHYLTDRLNLTSAQVHLLACVIFHVQATGDACDREDLSAYLGAHPLELYTMQEDIDRLVDAGYLEQSENHVQNEQWSVRKEAWAALVNNTPFDINTIRAADSLTFLDQCSSVIREGRHQDSDGSIERQIKWLFHLNQHLPITQIISRIAGDDPLVFKPLVMAVSLLSAEGAAFVDSSSFNMILAYNDVRQLMRALQSGKHPLTAKKIFEPFCSDNGMAAADQWVISKAGWMELLSQNMEEVNQVMSHQEELGRNLMISSQIPERKLFFSGKTKDEVNRLRQLLQDDQYRQIVDRLEQKNMPTGINILLYGLPGTGKTELVQQLARETGRDIFMVDMSQIRDKYVGQSEQNLAQIFKNYRGYVALKSKTPILFCNECDAIFGSRLERTAHSADKMENALQNILLEQMEKLRGIMICTTNLTSTLDKAFERRFLLKLQLPKPGNEARKQIWATMLPGLTDQQTTDLANRFDFSGGQIQNVTRKQIINSIFSGTDDLDFQRIIDDCNAETFDRTNGRQIGFK